MRIGSWIAPHLIGGRLMLASFGAAGTLTDLRSHFVYTAGLLTLGGALLHVRRHQLRSAALHRQELALRKEMLAYLLFNGSHRTLDTADLGRQISRLVSVRSSFGRAALVLRDHAGTLSVAGSAGFDDLSVEALNRWGRTVSDGALSMAEIASDHHRVASFSFTLRLERRDDDRNPLSTMSCKLVHIVPLQTAHGMLGALAVCTEPRVATEALEPLDFTRSHRAVAALPIGDLLQPLEALALRLTMQLTAPEDVTPIWPVRSSSRPDRHPDRYIRAARSRER
jgi:hypothetical protein